MNIFKPHYHLKNVLEIDVEFLKENNVKGLILDLDNTLSMHDNPNEELGVSDWLEYVQGQGIECVIVSNNKERRVMPLANKMKLPFVSFACKPFSWGLKKALPLFKCAKEELFIVGDQIFTDVLAGKFSGIKTVLVEPFNNEEKWSIRVKRVIENAVYNRKDKKSFKKTKKSSVFISREAE